MEFQARFPSVTAREATFADDGDKIMVLFKDGVPVEILPSVVFGVVYAPVDGERMTASAAAVRKQPGRAGNGKPPKKVAQGTAEGLGHGERTEQILAILRKNPMSSGELIEHLKCNSSIVYSTTHVMKGNGLVELLVSEHDGQKRWHPKGLI